MGFQTEPSWPDESSETLKALNAARHGRFCNRCSNQTLARRRLPWYLRTLGLMRIDLKWYRCSYCGATSVLRK